MKYRAEIDGLRALAVVPVIFFHAGFEMFSGGYAGVDVFFVISGYLITTAIVEEMDRGHFSLGHFYERRARRILPALIFVCLACIPVAWAWLLPRDMIDFSRSLAAVATFSSNILFWRESGYFDTSSDLKPLLHTWSLAVEEQYYILFPIFMLAVWRFGKRPATITLGLVFLLSLGCAHWGAYNKPAAAFYLLPTRGWELLVGVFTALYLHRRQSTPGYRLENLLAAMGLLIIVVAVLVFDRHTPFPSAYTLLPTLGTALIILYANKGTFVKNALASPVLVGIGLVSYSAYLWHHPLFAFARYNGETDANTVLFAGLSILSLVLAYPTWKYVETPFRNGRIIARRHIVLFGLVGTILLTGIGLAGDHMKGFPARIADDTEYQNVVHRFRINFGINENCDTTFSDHPSCRNSDTPEILLWGDSFAMHLAHGILAANPNAKMIQATVSQCPPILGLAIPGSIFGARNCIASNDRVFEFLRNQESIKYVVLGSPFDIIGNDAVIQLPDGSLVTNGGDMARRLLANTLQRIKALGKTPVVFSPPPRDGRSIGLCLMRAKVRGGPLSVCDFSRTDIRPDQQRVMEALRHINETDKVVWLDRGMCPDMRCMASSGNVLLFRDYGHLSVEGSAWLGEKMNFYGLIRAP